MARRVPPGAVSNRYYILTEKPGIIHCRVFLYYFIFTGQA
ncbi:hypothetical protein CSB69_4352 [Morganella morganii]|nr:hypothetical protein CSB69_4352 [Morganella morganii]